eukprot:m.48023 g.48023  ORF g.48023 m.48023 type:complete len:661 (+) comp11963_c0_seq1:124-2106(+)
MAHGHKLDFSRQGMLHPPRPLLATAARMRFVARHLAVPVAMFVIFSGNISNAMAPPHCVHSGNGTTVSAPAATAATATATPAVNTDCSITHGVSFDGRDIAAVGSGAQPEQCCSYCAGHNFCSAWTLYKGVCYLKDSAAGGHVTCNGCVSGALPGGAPCPVAGAGNCTVRHGYDVLPNGPTDIAAFTVASPGECCAACLQHFNCSAWTVYTTTNSHSNNINTNIDTNTNTQNPNTNSNPNTQNLSPNTQNPNTNTNSTCYLKPTFGGFKGGCPGCVSGVVQRGPKHPWPAPTGRLPRKFNMSGITFTGGRYCPNVTMGSTQSLRSLEHLASTGATWVAVVVTQYQWRMDSTQIFPLYNGSAVHDEQDYYTFVTLTSDEVTATIRHAHALGLRVMLKPHVDLLRNHKPAGAFWRGDIGGCPATWNTSVTPFTDAQWDAWFASYAEFLMPYAQLAEREHVEMLSVNTELYCPNRQEQRWRALVPRVRAVYSGLLTVAQIKGHEMELKWWDIVDVIGIDAYYSIPGDTVAELVYSWQSHVSLAKQLSDAYGGKPVAFTEIGYCSGHCSRSHVPSVGDYAKHALHYQAVLDAFANSEDWFLGVFFWNWNSDPGFWNPTQPDDCLTPQWKPAEDVLRWYWNATQPKPDRHAAAPALCMGAGKCTC